MFAYYGCKSVAAVMQHTRRTRRVVIGDLSDCTRLFHSI